MSAFANMLSGIGGLANAAGVNGDGPGGLNGAQRAALTPEQSIAYGKQSAIAQLASDPDFMKATPAARATAIAQITADPTALAAAGQQADMSSINLSDPSTAIKKLQPYMTPDQVTGIITNPMASSMMGVGGGGAAANTPAPASGAPQAPADPNAAPQAATTASSPVDYVKTHVPAFYQNQVMDILQGGELPKDIAPKDRNVLMNWAHNADPDFSEATAAQRATMIKNATSGDMYKLSTSLNTGMGHLYDLHQLSDGLHQAIAPIPAVTSVGNWLSTNLMPGGNPGVSRYEASLKTAAPEIAKYLGGGAATDTGTEEAQSAYSPSTPPDTIKQNATDLGAKMMTKGGTLQTEYDDALGKMKDTPAGSHQVVQPMTAALYADMQGKPLTLQQQQLVNQHRIEANLAPKKWGAAQTVSKPVPLNSPSPSQAAPSKEDALAALKARGRI